MAVVLEENRVGPDTPVGTAILGAGEPASAGGAFTSSGSTTTTLGESDPVSEGGGNGSGGGEPTALVDACSYEFNGTDETITFGDIAAMDIDNTQAKSYGLWFKRNGNPGGNTGEVMSKLKTGTSDGWEFRTLQDGNMDFYLLGPSGLIGGSVDSFWENNEWTFGMLTKSTASNIAGYTAYRNGVAKAITTIADTLSGTSLDSGPFNVLSRHAVAEEFSPGRATWIMGFDKKLSAAEVLALYNGGVPLDPQIDSGDYVSSADLVFFAPLGESTDTVESAGGILELVSANNGTAANMTNGANKIVDVPDGLPAIFTGSLLFDGVNEGGVNADTSGIATDDFSISCWVKGQPQDTKDIIDQFSTGSGNGLWAIATGKAAGAGTDKSIFTASSDGTAANLIQMQTGVSVFDGTWKHLVWTFESGTFKAYVDGVNDTGISVHFTAGTVNSIHSNVTSLAVGRLVNPATAFFNGKIAQINLWDTAVLEQADVTALFELGIGRDPRLIVPSGSQNLIHYWRMGNDPADSVPTTVLDLVGTRDLGLQNMAAGNFLTGDFPGELVDSKASVIFNGSDETISFGDVLDKTNTDAFSYSLWINPDNIIGTSKLLIAKDGPSTFQGYNCQQTNSGISVFFINNASGNFIDVRIASGFFADTTWVHLVVTNDGSSDAAGIKIYKNGASQSVSIMTDALTGTLANAHPLRLGARGTTPTSFFPGKLTDFVMYDKELTSGEVTELYNSGTAVNPLNLTTAGNVDLYAALGEVEDNLEASDGVLDSGTNGTDGTAVLMTNSANKSTDIP